MKWFAEARNKTTKEKPFDLKKELSIDLYLPGGTITLTDTRLVTNVEESFGEALDYIRSTLFEQLGLVEIYFTSRILFREADTEINLYPKIKLGISQMNNFLRAIGDEFPCDCKICSELKKRIADLFIRIQSKELMFTSDYSLEVGKEPNIGDSAEMYFSMENEGPSTFSSLRVPLDNPIYKEACGCLRDLFFRFASMHTVIFQMQEHEIMPVFMLIYKDKTHRTIPFVATSKATFYRKVNEVITIPDFDEVDAVFYCGEYYCYDFNQFPCVNKNKKPYSERIDMAQKEILAFVMMTKGGYEVSLNLDEAKIDDMNYVAEQFKQMSWEKAAITPFDWLNPILERLDDAAAS